MSYYHIQNIDIDKEKGTITGQFADSSVSPMTYFKSEIKGKDIHEKYSHLMYDIIAGNYHPNSSSKYYALCNAWADPPLRNFIGDCTILGVERTYDKYKNVIDALIKNKEPEIIKSEIELHYKIDYGENKDYKDLSQKVRDVSNFMQGIRNNKNLSHKDKLVIFKEFKEKIGLSNPLVKMIGMEHFTEIYLDFNITNDDYPSYKITVENSETGEIKTYKSESMNITWITDYEENEMAYKMQNYEKKFVVYEKYKEFINKNIFKEHSQNDIVKLEKLDLKDNEIRIFLDMLYEDDRSKDFKYDNKTKEIIFNHTKEVDITDEMFG